MGECNPQETIDKFIAPKTISRLDDRIAELEAELREQLASVTALADNRAVVITARNQEKIAAEQQRDALRDALELAVVEAGKFLSAATKAQVQAALKAAGRTGEGATS